jgi:L-2,4-diaminobutyrate decarboxylase
MTDARADMRSLFLNQDEGCRRAYAEAVRAAAAHVQSAWQQFQGATSGSCYEKIERQLGMIDVCPSTGVGLEAALQEVRDLVLPSISAVGHPEYAAHLHSVPIVPALAAEVIISATNQSLDSFDQAPSATAVERAVVAWLCAAFGLGPAADGVFTSGATKSNLMGLLLARDEHARTRLDHDSHRRGLPAQAAHWRILCSEHAHFSVERAAAILGLGEDSVVRLPADDHGVLRPETVRGALEGEFRGGKRPIALVLTAGTTDLGSIDVLSENIAVAAEHGVWTHVDAAAGGAFVLSDTHRGLLRGIERADSIAFDLHKLLFQPISCGVFLVRRAGTLELLRRRIPYLDPNDGELQAGPNLVAKSIETTRRFDALKVLVTLRALGRETLAALLDRTIATARHAAGAIAQTRELTLLAQPMTNTVLLRWSGGASAASPALANAVNRRVPHWLWRAGGPVVGATVYRGLNAVKLTFTNPLCSDTDVDRMLARLTAAAESVRAELEKEGGA